MSTRPAAITIVAVFLFLATAIAAVVGFSLLFPNPLLNRLWDLNPSGAALFHSIGRVSSLFLLALGCGTFLAARGLLCGRKWAWWFAVILFSVDVAGNVTSYFLIHDPGRTISGAIISLCFVGLLCSRSARAYTTIAA
ncbi:MAG TPA: hypothetical protein VIB39_07500 [Candidatus Angelobacter sp.]